MRNDINTVTISGKLAGEPETKYTGGGTAVINLRIENENIYKNDGEWQSSTSYFDATAWGNKAEQIGQKYEEGDVLWIEGELSINSWEGQGGDMNYDTEIDVDDFGTITQSGAPEPQPDRGAAPANQARGNQQPQAQAPPQNQGAQQGGAQQEFKPSDELPF